MSYNIYKSPSRFWLVNEKTQVVYFWVGSSGSEGYWQQTSQCANVVREHGKLLGKNFKHKHPR